MLDELLRRVSNHTPHTLETDGRFPEAAVLVPITRSDEPELILTLQGDGNYDGVAALVADKGVIKPQLAADLARLADADIPVDVVFNQGKEILGLK